MLQKIKTLLILTVVIGVAFSPLIIVWKEKKIRELSLIQEKLNEKNLQLQSETAEHEINIERLSAGERLERYALDSLGMVQPDPLEIMAVERDKDGAVVVTRPGFKGFLDKLMGY